MAAKNPAARGFDERAGFGRSRKRVWAKRLRRCVWPISPVHLLLAIMILYFVVAYFELGARS